MGCRSLTGCCWRCVCSSWLWISNAKRNQHRQAPGRECAVHVTVCVTENSCHKLLTFPHHLSDKNSLPNLCSGSALSIFRGCIGPRPLPLQARHCIRAQSSDIHILDGYLHQSTRLILVIDHGSLLPRNLARSRAITGRNIQRWVLQEEVPRPEQNCHWLNRHDWIVLRCWEVHQPECMPEHHVSIINAFITMLLNPLGKTS